MCGIAGILNAGLKQHQGSNSAIVRNMLFKIRYRGPDAQEVTNTDYATLGHCRLSIIDLAGGNQPMTSQDQRYHLVFNGEIYNYLELRSELKSQGVTFETFSDTEVLLKILIRYGEAAIKKLVGMFAFCFLDSKSGDWILCRDHFGIKPLYYTEINGNLLFSSEIKALLCHPKVRPTIHQDGLAEYLTFQYCLKDNTLFSGIKRLEPGQLLIGNRCKIHQRKTYWQIPDYIDHEHTHDYFQTRIEDILNDSIKLQVRSDVPLGSYLSGGIDSSLVTSLTASFLGKGLKTFHGLFIDGPQFDESCYAKQVNECVNGKLNITAPTPEDFVKLLPTIIYHMDEPLAGPGVFPQFVVSRDAAKQVKVILGGQGGDEMFGGYTRYLVALLENCLKHQIQHGDTPPPSGIKMGDILNNLNELRNYTPMMQGFFNHGLFEDDSRRYFRLCDRSPQLNSILSSDVHLDKDRVFSDFCVEFSRYSEHSILNKMTYFDIRHSLPALLHVEDRVSMAHSLESRVPLLDWRLMELVSTIPPEIKFANGAMKPMLKKIAAKHLPRQVVHRTDKMGFPVPIEKWLESGIVRDFVMDTLNSNACRQRGLYNNKIYQDIDKYGGTSARQIWGLLSLELWFQTFHDQGK